MSKVETKEALLEIIFELCFSCSLVFVLICLIINSFPPLFFFSSSSPPQTLDPNNNKQCNLTVNKRAVMSPPRFVEKLSSCKVDQGESITLSVKAIGNPLPNLTWLKVTKLNLNVIRIELIVEKPEPDFMARKKASWLN